MLAKVVDASVLGALVFGEPEAVKARDMLATASLYAPTLLGYELSSIARTKARRTPENRLAIEEALAIGLAMDIQWIEVAHVPAFRLAIETGLSSYDASYLYLAQVLSLPLVTFDEKLRSAAEKLGY